MIQQLRFNDVREDTSLFFWVMVLSLTRKWGSLDPNFQTFLITMRKTSKTKVFRLIACNSLRHNTLASWLTGPFPSLSPCPPEHQEAHDSDNHFWKDSRICMKHHDGVDLPYTFLTFLISEPLEKNYGTSCWPIWTWWGPNAADMKISLPRLGLKEICMYLSLSWNATIILWDVQVTRKRTEAPVESPKWASSQQTAPRTSKTSKPHCMTQSSQTSGWL